MKRDSQRKKVYRAEWDARDVLGRPSVDWAELKYLLDKEWDSMPRDVDRPCLRLAPRRTRTSCYSLWKHTIFIAPTMRCPFVLLHEIAHAQTARMVMRNETAWHGPEFVRELVAAVDRHLPFEVQQTYRASLRKNGVRR